jgi:hypothetical protein
MKTSLFKEKNVLVQLDENISVVIQVYDHTKLKEDDYINVIIYPDMNTKCYHLERR